MKSSSDSNAEIWRAYPKSRVDLWDQNLINGEYKIAYEFNPNLHQKVRSLLPKVRLLGESSREQDETTFWILKELYNVHLIKFSI